jgi:hypothetical protein
MKGVKMRRVEENPVLRFGVLYRLLSNRFGYPVSAQRQVGAAGYCHRRYGGCHWLSPVAEPQVLDSAIKPKGVYDNEKVD